MFLELFIKGKIIMPSLTLAPSGVLCLMFANEGEATVLVQGNTTVFPCVLVTSTCKVRRCRMERTPAELGCFILVVIINVECRVELHDRQTDSDEWCNSESSWLIFLKI